MSAFDGWVRGAPWLWISRREHALGFLAGFFIVGLAVVLFFPKPQEILLKIPSAAESEDADRVAKVLAFALKDETELVFFVGGSAVREYPPSDDLVSKRLGEECGRPLRFVGLGASNQTFAETWALVEAARQHRVRAVLYGMTYARFEYDLVSIAQSLDSMLTPVPRPAALANWLSQTWLRYVPPFSPVSDWARALRHAMPKANPAKVWRLFSEPAVAPAPPEDPFQTRGHFYKAPVLSKAEKDAIVDQYIGSRILPFAESVKDSTYAWRALITQTIAWGARPVLLVLPEDPSMAKVDQLFRPSFDTAIDELKGAGAIVHDLRENTRLTSVDFYDQQHLVASGRRIEFERLIAAVKAAIPGCGDR